MSSEPVGLPGFVLLYAWARETLPLANGRPRSRRSIQEVIQNYGLEGAVSRIGHIAWIDPEIAAQILRDRLKGREPRKPGRPPRAA